MTWKLLRDEHGVPAHETTTPATPGRAPASARIAARPQIVLRVESAEAARAIAGAFGPRDDNGVAAGADVAVDRAAATNGAPLPDGVRTQFESSLGADLSSVRVHTGAESAAAASAVGAKAYTVGQDIHFADGHYAPSDPFGVHLLAHEVAHTVQQQGSAPVRQNKLEVSTPGDAAELEADRAADAMVAGSSAAAGPSQASWRLGGLQRSMADDMRRGADAQQKIAIADGPPKTAEMSSLETVAQANDCIKKVIAANGNLYQRRASQQSAAKDAGDFSEERVKLTNDVAQTDTFISKNEGVIGSLQNIVDLGQGNSQTNAGGNRPGFDMQLGVFTQLAQVAFQDFARLQGVVNSFLAAHPMHDTAGAAGGNELGAAVATGGAGGPAALAKVKAGVSAAQGGDAELNNLMQDYKHLLADLEGSDAKTLINSQMEKCASAISEAKNVVDNAKLGVSRPDTADQAAAKAEADQVNAALDGAKNALGQAVAIAKLAVSVMGMPEIGVLGEGSALTPVVTSVTTSPTATTAGQVGSAAGSIVQGAGKIGGVDVQKKVSEDITTAVAKMMTDYDAKITAADGHAQQANANAKRDIVKLERNQLNKAKGDITAAFAELSRTCATIETKKSAVRAKAAEIEAHQKKNKKPGQPDIGAITTAIAECAAFVQQADAAIVQGDGAHTTAADMAATRHNVAGDYQKSNAVEAFSGVKELGVATNEQAFIDCEPTPPHLLSQHPLSFRIRSDNAGQNSEVAGMEVGTMLDDLKADRETAIGFETALKSTLGI